MELCGEAALEVSNTLTNRNHHLALLLPVEDEHPHEHGGSEVNLDQRVEVAVLCNQHLHSSRPLSWRQVEVTSDHRPLRVLPLRIRDGVPAVEGGDVGQAGNHLGSALLKGGQHRAAKEAKMTQTSHLIIQI